MRATWRQSMTWLHTWSGLVLGWVLFAVFLTGTATYFRWEITHWMRPELHASDAPLEAAEAAARHLEQVAPSSPQWFIDLPDARTAASSVVWRTSAAQRGFELETLDATTGEKATARESYGGEFFYRFHFQFLLPNPWGRYLAGVAAMAMLIALLTGIVAHRRFFADLFTFRAGRPGLRSWLDFHNVAGVLALPFYLTISYSALVIFVALYLPWGRLALANTATASAAVARTTPSSGRTASPAAWIAPAPLAPMIRQVENQWGATGRTAKRIEVALRGTDRCVVTFTRQRGSDISIGQREQLRFNGVTGAPLQPTSRPSGLGTATHDVLYGLHLAQFAGIGLRWLCFFMGLLGTALIGTGLIMATIRRRARIAAGDAPSLGLRVVERLNVTTLAGLPLAIGVFFWANRLLPLHLSARSDWEVRCFLGAWAAALLHAVLRSTPCAWREQLGLGAVLYLGLPGLDALTAPAHLAEAWRRLDGAYLGFHAAMIGCGLLLGSVALRVGRPAKKTAVAATFAASGRIKA